MYHICLIPLSLSLSLFSFTLFYFIFYFRWYQSFSTWLSTWYHSHCFPGSSNLQHAVFFSPILAFLQSFLHCDNSTPNTSLRFLHVTEIWSSFDPVIQLIQCFSTRFCCDPWPSSPANPSTMQLGPSQDLLAACLCSLTFLQPSLSIFLSRPRLWSNHRLQPPLTQFSRSFHLEFEGAC
jgi:hypothetical protein